MKLLLFHLKSKRMVTILERFRHKEVHNNIGVWHWILIQRVLGLIPSQIHANVSPLRLKLLPLPTSYIRILCKGSSIDC
jgi:hypothetical protein